MLDYLPFILFLMLLAVFLQAESALTIFYLILGSFLLGLWWNKRALQHIQIHRKFDDHAFLSEKIPVQLVIENKSILPILWIEIHESLPVNLRAGVSVKHVFSLASRGKKVFDYHLTAFKRGFYPVGPLVASSGDPLGLTQPTQIRYPADFLTIYPRIIPLKALGLRSRSPFGTLKHRNPVFEDASRTIGKRNYEPGDSIRRIDWKSTAATGTLQVRLYEASIALDIALILDLHTENYDMHSLYDAAELSIVAAASLAAWGHQQGQSIGLFTNGIDPENGTSPPQPLPPRKGSGHLIQLLENLARIQLGKLQPISLLIQNALADLPWGTTLVLISGGLDENTLKQLFQARKKGLNTMVLLCGHPDASTLPKDLAMSYHIPIHTITTTRDLEILGSM
jgi:uncharacterized protein (DUF58 family)